MIDQTRSPCAGCRTAALRRLTYAQAAAELHVEESWLRRHIRRLPHTKLGRVVYFTDDDLRRIDSLFHHEPATPAPAASTGQLVPLPSRRRRANAG
ncbi:helix-turn-helix domain-containing protein [Streptomyces collinus]|uniref:helix-turn-helix domain-containing protein n=1 Tax=Streptomyces collinus TaxID=42684 RepID=UPI00339F98F4